jgi:nucleoside kinase
LKPFLSVYGHVSIDQILSVTDFPELNHTADIVRKDTRLGGTGTNIAARAAALGVPTAICAFVGMDFPQMYEDRMRARGLIMDEFVRVEDFETSQAIVVNDKALDQKVLFYQGPQGHATQLKKYLTSNARNSDYVHFCTGEPEYYITIMNMIDMLGNKIAVDPAQEIYKAWDGDTFKRALNLSDYLFCNQHEEPYVRKFTGVSDLSELKKEMVVCTKGAAGSAVYIDGEKREIPAVKPARVRDCTGAGDAYRAGFYAGLYTKHSVPESLVIASASASFAVEDVGALTNIPSFDAVMGRAEPYLRDL